MACVILKSLCVHCFFFEVSVSSCQFTFDGFATESTACFAVIFLCFNLLAFLFPFWGAIPFIKQDYLLDVYMLFSQRITVL